MLVFLHIEKTGGGSIITSLERDGVKVARPMHKVLSSEPTPTLEDCIKSGAQVYESHFDPLFLCPMSIKQPVYSIIREPVARTVSHIKFLYLNRDKDYVRNDPEMAFLDSFKWDSIDCWRLAFRHCPYLVDLQVRRLAGRTHTAKVTPNDVRAIRAHKSYHVYPLWRIVDVYRALGGKGQLTLSGVSEVQWDISPQIADFIRSNCACDLLLWNTINEECRTVGYLD